jgi:flavin-dependent dehydrogenase
LIFSLSCSVISYRPIPSDPTLDRFVIIVGGGPAGVSTWLHLHKYAPHLAEHCLVIEKSVFPRDKVCAGGLGAWSAAILDSLAIKLEIPSLFISDVKFKFGKSLSRLHRHNWFRVVRRLEFDHVLARTAMERGLELHENERVLDLFRERNTVVLRTDKREYRAKIIVGADGAMSVVRRAMMPSRKQNLAPTIQVVTPIKPPNDREFHKKEIFLDLSPIRLGLQGYLWHVPCLREGVPSIAHGIVDFRLYRGRPRAQMEQIFYQSLQSRYVKPDPKSWSSHPIRWFSNDVVISCPNVLLGGDAAGIEPAFGGGIHLALAYGRLAAETIIEAAQTNDFSFQDYKKRFQTHLVGKLIHKFTLLAQEMYAEKTNPLKAVKAFFTEKDPAQNLLSLMLSPTE